MLTRLDCPVSPASSGRAPPRAAASWVREDSETPAGWKCTNLGLRRSCPLFTWISCAEGDETGAQRQRRGADAPQLPGSERLVVPGRAVPVLPGDRAAGR